MLFIVGALVTGRAMAPLLFRLVSRLHGKGVVFTSALVTCFVLAWTAELVGLAPIVGAFAAGLVLEGVPFGELLPRFFVLMGAQVRLQELAGGSALLALALTAAAIIGKQACGLAVVTRGADRLTVGLCMIRRGEGG